MALSRLEHRCAVDDMLPLPLCGLDGRDRTGITDTEPFLHLHGNQPLDDQIGDRVSSSCVTVDTA
jgi:hypothetical protein